MATPSRLSRIPRIQAFSEQGVTLAYPARSWSGVREDDGAVVIGMREAEVHVCADGFRCLLWSPVIEGATEWIDRPNKEERLGHCRRAFAWGGADGLIVCGTRAEVERGSVLSLRVEKAGAEYWAFWGTLIACASGRTGLRRDPAYAPLETERLAA
jgi:hypothetical protein